MKTIKFDPSPPEVDAHYPEVDAKGAMVCVAGFELLHQDEDSYRCSGGNHIYRISSGRVIFDKFGNLMLTGKPDGMNGEESRR